MQWVFHQQMAPKYLCRFHSQKQQKQTETSPSCFVSEIYHSRPSPNARKAHSVTTQCNAWLLSFEQSTKQNVSLLVSLPWMKTEHFLDSTLDLFSVFSWKTFFLKFELRNSGCDLSASAAYAPVFTVLSFLVDSVLKRFKKSPHFQTSNSMINTLTSVSSNNITKLPILCGHSSHSFHSISIRHKILRDFSVLWHDIWGQKDIA